MFFGEFLVHRGVITNDDLFKALNYQMRVKIPIGYILIVEKKLKVDDAIRTLNVQRKHTSKRFGEVAIELGLITREDLEKAISIQQIKGPKIGEVLVELGIILPKAMEKELEEYKIDELSRVIEDYIQTEEFMGKIKEEVEEQK